MKRLFFILALMANWIVANATYLFVNSGGYDPLTESWPARRDIFNDEDSVRVRYQFYAYEYNPDPLYSSSVLFKLDGFGESEDPGIPATLQRTDSFVVPDNATVSLEITHIEYEVYGFVLGPGRYPLIDSSDESYTLNNVPPVMQINMFFPGNFVDLGTIDEYRGTNIVNVIVSPIRHNPVTHETRFIKNLEYKLTFTSLPEEDGLAPLSFGPCFTSTPNSNLPNIILNSPSIENASDPNLWITQENNSHYLIVTSPEFEKAAARFAKWKRQSGFNVDIAYNNSWTPDAIFNCVKTNYLVNGTEFLLIIGDHQHVPAMDKTFSVDHIDYVTDLYYGCMGSNSLNDGNDSFPDIYRGRIPVSTSEEAERVIDKIIDFEKNPPQDSNFYSRGVHCAYYQTKPGDRNHELRRFVLTSEEIKDYVESKGKNVSRIYTTDSQANPTYWNQDKYSFGGLLPADLRTNFNWNGNESMIQNQINQGAFYVLHRDHGSESGWGDPYFGKNSINGLQNNNLLPIVFSLNCLTGKFQSITGTGNSARHIDCFAESFLKKENGGCSAIFAATRTSFSGYNDALACGMFDAVWPSPGLIPQIPKLDYSPANTPAPTYYLGQILDQGLTRMSETYAKDKYQEHIVLTREIFHLFGDPSMQFPTARPTVFSNASITRTNSVVSVNAHESAIITFYDTLTETVNSFRGSEASITSDHPECIQVCLTGHNKVPYLERMPSTVPSHGYIYNPAYYNNKILFDYEFPVDFSHAGVELSNRRLQISHLLPVQQENATTGSVTLSQATLDNLGYTSMDVFDLMLKNVQWTLFTSAAPNVFMTMEYRPDDSMPLCFTTNNLSNLQAMPDSIRFVFTEPVYCHHAMLSVENSEPVHVDLCEDVDFDGPLMDFISCLVNTESCNFVADKISITEAYDYLGFRLPDDYLNLLLFWAGTPTPTLLSVYPSPEENDWRDVYDHGQFRLKFDEEVTYASGAILEFNFLDKNDFPLFTFEIYGGNIIDTFGPDGNFYVFADFPLIADIVSSQYSQLASECVAVEVRAIGLQNIWNMPLVYIPCVYYDYELPTSPLMAPRNSSVIYNFDDENVVIYDITGKRIESSPSELDRGLYIINGKKVLIK